MTARQAGRGVGVPSTNRLETNLSLLRGVRLLKPPADEAAAPPVPDSHPGPGRPFDVANTLFAERIVTITSAIDETSAAVVCRQLIALDRIEQAPISLYIMSTGGDSPLVSRSTTSWCTEPATRFTPTAWAGPSRWGPYCWRRATSATAW